MKPVWEDIMKYDGSAPEPPYDTECPHCAELQRRLDAIVEELEPGDPPCDCIDDDGPDTSCCGYNIGDWGRAWAWMEGKGLHARVKAIAEGKHT